MGKEKQKTKEEGQQGDSWGGGNRSNERLEGKKKTNWRKTEVSIDKKKKDWKTDARSR